MKSAQSIVCIILALGVAGNSLAAEPRSLRPLFDAIRWVETSDRPNPPDGDGGRAIGPYQIWRAYWQDAVEKVPTLGGTYQDVRKKEYAERCMIAYWLRYCPHALKRRDYRTLAVVHHLGPRPERRPKEAKAYWRKIVKALNRKWK